MSKFWLWWYFSDPFIVDTATTKSGDCVESKKSDIHAALEIDSNVENRKEDAKAKLDVSKNGDAKTIHPSKKSEKVNLYSQNGMPSAVESGFVSFASSSSNSNDETNVSTFRIQQLKSSQESNDYVNFSNSKSFLKVDLKSAIYSRGYLSIWVKVTYRIYEKVSEKDWIGLYYIGKLCLLNF